MENREANNMLGLTHTSVGIGWGFISSLVLDLTNVLGHEFELMLQQLGFLSYII